MSRPTQDRDNEATARKQQGERNRQLELARQERRRGGMDLEPTVEPRARAAAPPRPTPTPSPTSKPSPATPTMTPSEEPASYLDAFMGDRT